MNFDHLTGRLAERYGVSEGAVLELHRALERGGWRLAQFSHPELGGYGQWMPGMTQIGDMFNRELRSRVERLCEELNEYGAGATTAEAGTGASPTREERPALGAARSPKAGERPETHFMKPMQPMEPMKPMSGMKPMKPMAPMQSPKRWWPQELGESPNSAGGQNETRYAFFGDKQRLAIDTGDGKVQVYDTGDHRISGVQQHQSGGGRKVTFTSQHGEVDLAQLQRV